MRWSTSAAGARWLEEHPLIGERWLERLASDTVFVGVDRRRSRRLRRGRRRQPRHQSGRSGLRAAGARELGFGDAMLAAGLAHARARGAVVFEGEALPGDRDTKNLYERAGITARLITVSTRLDR